MFKKSILAGLAVAVLGAGAVQAQQAPASPHAFTGNIGLFSQYIFRGLTQTNGDPALQGGVDYSHSKGFYLGTWASNISWLKENATSATGAETGHYGSGGHVEVDFYGGYKFSLSDDMTVDLGTLYYWYPGDISTAYRNPLPAGTDTPKADTWEIYYALTWKWLSFKLSYSLMNRTFTVADSKGSAYFDLSANYPLTKQLTLNAHVGKQQYAGVDRRNGASNGFFRTNNDVYGYKDYKLGLSYALPRDLTVGAFYSKTESADVCGYGAYSQIGLGGCTGTYPKNIAKETGTIFISKTF